MHNVGTVWYYVADELLRNVKEKYGFAYNIPHKGLNKFRKQAAGGQ